MSNQHYAMLPFWHIQSLIAMTTTIAMATDASDIGLGATLEQYVNNN